MGYTWGLREGLTEGGLVYFILELSEADILVKPPLYTLKTPLSTLPRFNDLCPFGVT